jgi:ribosomal-protein-alanine N-acetyltransferase
MPLNMPLDCGSCLVRSWRHDDLYSLVQHLNNRNIWVHLRDRVPFPYTESDGNAWLDLATSQEPVTDFAIEQEGHAVGGMGLVLKDDVEFGTAELGYWLSESLWGRGLCTAAVQGLVPWAFSEFDLRRIYALPFAGNKASRRVLEKAGFQLEGTLRQHILKDGRVQDQAVYGKLCQKQNLNASF